MSNDERKISYAIEYDTKNAKQEANSFTDTLKETGKEAEKTEKILKKFREKWKVFWEKMEEKDPKKISEAFDVYNKAYKALMDNFTGTMDMYKSVLKNHIDDMKKEVEGIDRQIAQVQEKQREASANQLSMDKQMETSKTNQLKNATMMSKKQREEESARIAQLEKNIAAETESKQALAAEEARLQEEKEKKNKEIAKQEKRMRKVELGQSMIKATVNTAEAVTKMLALMFPLNIAMAAVVTAMGVAQVGIIGRQIRKLGDGGLLKGPSHANGGILIPGNNIEVEGGEYVVNKASTAQNLPLLNYINSSRQPVFAADIAAGRSMSGVPEMPFVRNTTEERLLAAIEKINITPVVSVSDIIDAQKTVVTVRDIAGF